MEISRVRSEHPIRDFLILGAGFAILQFLIFAQYSPVITAITIVLNAATDSSANPAPENENFTSWVRTSYRGSSDLGGRICNFAILDFAHFSPVITVIEVLRTQCAMSLSPTLPLYHSRGMPTAGSSCPKWSIVEYEFMSFLPPILDFFQSLDLTSYKGFSEIWGRKLINSYFNFHHYCPL